MGVARNSSSWFYNQKEADNEPLNDQTDVSPKFDMQYLNEL